MIRKSSFRVKALLLIAVLVVATLGASVKNVQAQGGTDTKERAKIDVESGGKALDVLKQLRTLDLVPSGGKVAIQVPRAGMNVVKEGVWFTPIGRGTKVRDFVLNFEIRARNIEGETDSCGFMFRIDDKDVDNTFSSIMLTNDRRIQLRQMVDGEAIVDYDESVDDMDGVDATDYALDDASMHIVTLVANGETLTLFLNGLEITTQDTAKSLRGVFATRLFNEEGHTANTFCAFSTMWVWSFDK